MPNKKTSLPSEIQNGIPAKELSALLAVSNALAASLDMPVVLQTAIDSAVDVLHLDTGAIYVLEGERLYLGATTPELPREFNWLIYQPEWLNNHPHLKQAMTQCQPVILPDARAVELSPSEAEVREARRLVTVLYAPLLCEQKAVGALIVGTTEKVRVFSDYELDLCRILSNQISLAVANARLFKSVKLSNVALTQSYDATLEGWSLALELRDQETRGHTLRVTQMTENLARKMGVGEEALSHMRRGALLHDIGKMGVPDTILRKPGPLSDEEWTIMRQHPDYAYQFLVKIDFLAPALDIPNYHHEKWDGSGYPRGLKGEAIPLAARIFAVVDVYDALTSNRPYRLAWSEQDVLAYIKEQAGQHFDPAVVKAFIEMVGG